MPELSTPLRIAMWSGPRNISTAMMRAWGNRIDTVVMDEPFYAFYLSATGKKHPGAEEIVARGETDWQRIVKQLTEPSSSQRILYQKQMTHHLLPEVNLEWLGQVTNCFLIRHPAEVIASYIKKKDDPTLDDLGFVQQARIFDWVCQAGTPPVIDAKDVLQDPRRILTLLCQAIGVEFSETMLSWPPGRRPTDGIWAKYWYDAVERSTSFQPYRPKSEPVPDRFRPIYERCLECYERLYQYRLH